MPTARIVKGPDALKPLPKVSLGELIFDSLLRNRSQNDVMINIATRESLSYDKLFLQTYKTAEVFKKIGLKQNDVISICSENNLYFLQPVIAALYLGIITAPINFNYTPREILHAVSISKPKIVFCSEVCLSKVLEIQKQAQYIEKIIVFGTENIRGTESFTNFIKGNSLNNPDMNGDGVLLRNIDINEQVAVILYSSGTTGLPKGVMITQKNIHVRMAQLNTSRRNHPSTKNDALSFLPLFHAFGFMVTLGFIISSKRIFLLSKFDEKLYLEVVQKYKIPTLWLIPSLAVFLAKSPLVDKYDLSHVKEITSGSAPLKKDIEELLKKRFNIPVIGQAYGLTEATLAVTTMPPGVNRPGSVGKVVPMMSIKVVDPETKKLLGPGEPGELYLKGGLVSKGYFNNPTATSETFDKDGWLHTGDIGYYDEDEYFYIVDRLKELIKYKGYQVPPAELEKILLTHPDIQDAGVVGVPHETAGELPLAFVIKVPDSKLTEKEIQDFVANQVSPQKRLHGGVIFVNQLPKSLIGKLLRKELREMVKKHKGKL